MQIKPVVINVNPAGSIQAAIDGLPATGGLVRIQAGSYVLTTPLVLRRGTRLVGESWSGYVEPTQAGPYDSPVKISCADPNTNIITLDNAPFCQLENLQIVGAGTAGTQIGVYATWHTPGIDANGAPASVIGTPSLRMKNVLVQNCGATGVQVDNYYLASFDTLICQGNVGRGMYVVVPASGLTNPHYLFDNCWWYGNGSFGLDAWRLGPAVFRSCSWQANAGGSSCQIVDSSGFDMQQCNWEGSDSVGGLIRLDLVRCANFTVSGFFQNDTAQASRGIRMTDCHHFDIGRCLFQRLTTSAILMVYGSIGCYNGKIKTPNIPLGDATAIEGTEGSTYFDVEVLTDELPVIYEDSPVYHDDSLVTY